MPLGSLVSGFIGAGGASAAGSAAGAAGGQALKASQDLANSDVARYSPFFSTGLGAENQLSQLYGIGKLVPYGDQYNTYSTVPLDPGDQANAFARFQTSPGYSFRLQQGVNALDRSAASKGMLLSGAQGKAITDYGQNTASNEWGNYINQLNALAGGGLSAAGGASSAANDALKPGINDQFLGSMGQASSYSNSANALASGIGSAINSLGSLAAFGFGGGFGGGQAGGYSLGSAPAGGYGGYAGYANTLPGFGSV